MWPPQVTCNPSWQNPDSSEELTPKTGLGVQLRGLGMLLSLVLPDTLPRELWDSPPHESGITVPPGTW